MGKIMKTIRPAIIVVVALFLASAVHTFAIEGLQLSVQSSNVVLSWPSVDDGSETYLVQYRQTLNATDSWQTLADYLPAAGDTNMTCFVHSNIVQYPQVELGGGGNISPPGSMDSSSGTGSAAAVAPPMPMAIPANGSGDAVPLAIYPPGFDFSGFVIFDPATGESVSGNGYSVSPSPVKSVPDGGFEPMDDDSGNTNVNTGFYRVVRDGAHLVGITNGMTLSGIVIIPVELANDNGNVSTISLTENDSPVGDSIQTAPFHLPLALVVDTTQMSNGVHEISASARWDILGATNDESGGLAAEADSPPVSVNVYNEISFPNWMPEFGELGNTLLIRATSAHTNVDWTIDVYDSQHSYIGTFGGHTDDGDITVVWDLIGPDGEPHTNDAFFTFFITTPYSDPPTPPIYKRMETWSGSGAWVAVAQHAWDNYNNSDLLYAELSGLIGGAKQAGWQVRPPVSQDDYGNWDAYPLHFNDSQGDSDWQAFRNALYDPSSRNLVYFGHGGPDGIGANAANANRYTSATEIANMLHTMPLGQTNRHSFRFVFLDGCSTAKGTLPEAFGIFHRENVSGTDYADASLRYSAFVGWPENKMIGFGDNTGQINLDHVNFITYIQLEMLGSGYSGSPQSIKQAIVNASTYPGLSGFNANSLKVYGFWGLTFGLDNY
jgi:hypothetical protein